MEGKEAIIRRLRKVEGQVKGIQKMVEEDQFCGDVLVQVAAARSALNSVGGIVLENYMKACLVDHLKGINKEEDLEKLVELMVKYTKQN